MNIIKTGIFTAFAFAGLIAAPVGAAPLRVDGLQAPIAQSDIVEVREMRGRSMMRSHRMNRGRHYGWQRCRHYGWRNNRRMMR